MRKYLLPFLFCGPGIIFGYWGAFTKSGGKHYDEMDGMTPFFTLVIFSFVLTIWIFILLGQYLKKYYKERGK
jgi:hypothetical protein